MKKSTCTPRVRELLDEMASVITNIKAEISENNSKLGGVLDDLLMKIDEAQNEIAEGKASQKYLISFVRIIADLIEIICKLQDTLFYKLCCVTAALYRKRGSNDHRKKYKVIQNYCWA